MNIIISAMKPGDAAAVHQLSVQLGYTNTVPETLERILYLQKSEQDCVLVASLENDVAGWIHAFKTTRLEAGNYTEIAALVVDSKYRGQKIGEQLVKAIKDWSRQEGYHKLVVRSNIFRNRAHHFYITCGFAEVKEHKVFELSL